MHDLARKLIPLNPCKREYVYTAHVSTNIIMVTTVRLICIWNSSPITLAINGVARLNVVAVPANSANTASKSINRPRIPSVYLPRIGRHASEYF